MTVAALKIESVESGYDEAPVIRGISLDVQPGAIVTILGKNGMGKSTLLKTIMGFVRATKGQIEIFGDNVIGEQPYRIARHAVSYTPQEYTLFQDLTVEENLRLGVPDDLTFHQRFEHVGHHFPVIPERLKQRAGTLSGGEQKMLLVSRALVARPKLMLIDELTEGLQPTVIAKLAEVLKEERDRTGMAILLVEQNLRFALSIADSYAVLNLGQIIDRGDDTSAGTIEKIAEELSV